MNVATIISKNIHPDDLSFSQIKTILDAIVRPFMKDHKIYGTKEIVKFVNGENAQSDYIRRVINNRVHAYNGTTKKYALSQTITQE